MENEEEGRSPGSGIEWTGRIQFLKRPRKRQKVAPRKLPTSTAPGIRAPKEELLFCHQE
jgi:hypothetical protein